MPNADVYLRVVGDLEGLAGAVDENIALLPDVQAERTALSQSLTKLKTLKDRQISLTAARQETTQELKKALVEGRQVAEKIRDAVKFKIGRRNERLVQFNIAPLRKRTRKPAAIEKKEPPVETPDVKK
jgi:hypothetical protein